MLVLNATQQIKLVSIWYEGCRNGQEFETATERETTPEMK